MKKNNGFYNKRKNKLRKQRKPVFSPKHFKNFNLETMLQHFTEALRKAKSLTPSVVHPGEDNAEMVRQAQLTQLTSALDYYMHELGRYGMTQIFMGVWKPNKHYKKYGYKFTLPEIEGIILSDRQEEDTFRDIIGTKEHRLSYMQPNKIQDLFDVLGISYNGVCNRMNCDPQYCYDILKAAGDNRNIVTHQAGRLEDTAEYISIGQEEIDKYSSFIEEFVRTVHLVASKMKKRSKAKRR